MKSPIYHICIQYIHTFTNDNIIYTYIHTHISISGWWCNNNFEKYEFVNGEDDIPYMKWKIKFMFLTTNQGLFIMGNQRNPTRMDDLGVTSINKYIYIYTNTHIHIMLVKPK